jgi:hypothetical protein
LYAKDHNVALPTRSASASSTHGQPSCQISHIGNHSFLLRRCPSRLDEVLRVIGTPPHLLRKLLESKDKEVRQAALNTLLAPNGCGASDRCGGSRVSLPRPANAGGPFSIASTAHASPPSS